MANNNKKYVSLTRLSTFLENIKARYSLIGHKHTTKDITDYVVDSELKSNSNNPVANSVLNEEFDAISDALGALELAIDGKSDSTHNHDSSYYTKTYLDSALSNKSDKTHNHDTVYAAKNHNHDGVYSLADHNHDTRYDAKYEPKGTASSAVSAHNTNTTAHADIRDLITGLTTRLNTLANSDDTTLDQLSEIVAYIKNNKSLIDGVTTNKVNVADIVNNLTTNVTNKPLSAAQGVAIKALIDALDSALDSHDANTTKHITSTERTNWNAAKTHADSAHAPSNAQPNQNAFSNIKVGSTTIAADTTTDTLTLEGSNVTITPDATNDKVTISVADATTSAKGVVKLSDSVTSDSSATSATSYAVKSAFDLAGRAMDLANSKADSTHNHTVSQIGDLTVSASELNYMDGVTSNVQVQLDSKQPSITGGASTIASSNLTANRALVSNSSGKVAVSLVTADELGYLDGVTSNVQEQLDNKADYIHNHSATEITSGTMDVARLPKASETASGILTTGTQTIAGAKTFTSTIKPAGVYTSGHITASSDSTYDIGGTTKAFRNAYVDNIYINPQTVSGSIVFSGSFESEKEGTTTQTGVAKLKVGNPVIEGKAGNAQGYVQIYNENNGSVTLQTSHSDDYAFRVNLPKATGTLVTNNEVYTIEDHEWTLLYDSGEISDIANSISNIDVSGYTNIEVLIRCYNDGDSIGSRTGSAIFTAENGKSYQFPVWTNMFSNSISTVSTMAHFKLVDGWLVCPFASRLIGEVDIFDTTEGGTAGNLTPTGSGMMKCTSPLSTLTVSSLDQNSNYYFGSGSRVMVWGWNA